MPRSWHWHFYPRSPCGERLKGICFNAEIPKFLSTLSLRRATAGPHGSNHAAAFLSTLSLRRATVHELGGQAGILISIHALLAESDSACWRGCWLRCISIHALLAESDEENTTQKAKAKAFLSTLSLRRATQLITANLICRFTFLSTLSLRRATPPVLFVKTVLKISIHALLAESDIRSGFFFHLLFNFYPRSPCGERPPRGQSAWIRESYFYPRSPCGERQLAAHTDARRINFYPRSPCGERPL